MPADPRLALARKYHLDGLHDDAWSQLRDLIGDGAETEVLVLAATVCAARHDPAQSLALCERILAADAHHGAAHFNRALALEALGRPDQAIEAYEQAIAAAPEESAARNNLGALLMAQGRFGEAVPLFAAALARTPDNAAARINFGVAQVERGEVAAGLAAFDQVLAADPANVDASDNRLFAAHYIEDDPERLWRLHRDWGARCTGRHRTEPHPANGRLRIGYVSPDFRRHSVSFFSLPLIAAHSPVVEVYCYSTTLRPDDVTRRFQAHAHWRDIARLGTAQAVDLIRRDRIDVLVDLAGHTVGNRLDIFAARAAPLQVTALGYPGTTGLSTMDARLCDAVTDPPEMQPYSVERLLPLAAGLHCYEPPTVAPSPGQAPCLASAGVTFGSFNKLAKLSPQTIALWAHVLEDVPNSRLLLKAKALAEPETAKALAARFAAHGISADRLEMVGWLAEDAGHLGLYGRVDIALDTTPYNGTTTTCEALWMGVPVITLAGRAHAARVGASLLSTVGLRENICATPRHYVERAAELASDKSALAAIRAGLRARVAASPLCDASGYARAVEAAFGVLRAC